MGAIPMVARNFMFVADVPDALVEEAQRTAPAIPGPEGIRQLNPFECLSAREREIAGLVAVGASNKEIARQLRISPNTVSSHLRQIFAKLGLVRRAELCRLWYRAESLQSRQDSLSGPVARSVKRQGWSLIPG